jgi:hypothetical protein
MTLLKQHLNSMKRVHVVSCQMCGKKHTWSVRYAGSMFVLRVERVRLSLSCFIDFHDDLMYGLGLMDHVELFGVKKLQFKKANAVEVRKNKTHMKKLMKKYNKDIGDMD